MRTALIVFKAFIFIDCATCVYFRANKTVVEQLPCRSSHFSLAKGSDTAWMKLLHIHLNLLNVLSVQFVFAISAITEHLL